MTKPSATNKIIENFLPSMQLQWLLGDWHRLSQISNEQLVHQPEKSLLALMVATALLQQGQVEDAKAMLSLAKEWGADEKLMASYLISGVKNTLGRAHAVLKQTEKSYELFEQAINQVKEGCDCELTTQLRTLEQTAQLGFKKTWKFIGRNQRPSNINIFEVKQLNALEVGEGWAGNSVNTVIFRNHALITKDDFQYTAFYVNCTLLKIVQRKLSDNAISDYEIKGEFNLNDAHNSISLGMDRAGYLHMSFDHHGTKLRYRRMLSPHNIQEWTNELPMTGKHEEKVTYPSFILPYNNQPLLILYRDGNWKQGSAYLKSYDEENLEWSDYEFPILSGSEQRPWTSNAYWNHPAVGDNGSLHLSYVWRTDYFSSEQLINNINIGYAQSFDHGQTWFSSNLQPYKLPITQVNSEVAWPIAPGSNLINQTSMEVDSHNYPHIVFYANDINNVPQYQHIWFNGEQWQITQASNRIQPFTLSGKGTLQLPISRPVIILDENDNVYMIHRGLETKERMAVTFLAAPHYKYDTKNVHILWHKPLGFAEPIIDRTRWQTERVLSLFLQYNEQPSSDDLEHHAKNSNVTLLDIEFTFN